MRPKPSDVLFYLGRHGATALNQEDRFHGSLDADLDVHGRREAQSLSDFFERVKLGGILTSDRSRAVETALTIGEHRGLVPEIEPDLRSWDMGYLAGQPKDDHKDEIQHYVDHPDETIPQGESLNAFRQRVKPFFQKAMHLKQQTGVPHILLGHSSVIREASNVFNGHSGSARIKPGGALAVMHTPKGIKAIPIFKPDTGK